MDNQDLRRIVDSSGFAFQLAVEDLVKKAGDRFKVIATEHAWMHPSTHRTGFADIILESGPMRLVVECKRVREGQWVFLRADDRLTNGTIRTYRADLLWTGVSSRGETSATDSFVCVPESPQCPFCTVRGSGEEQQSMLERVAGTLLEATEAVAHEQQQIETARRQKAPDLFEAIWFYVPVIVTNSTLNVCSFDPATVDPAKGVLPEGATFVPATIVRFAKNLSFDIDTSGYADLTAANRAKNRTVLVVTAAALADFLRAFTIAGELPNRLRRFRDGM
jgi:hypothetical protein